MCKEKHKQQHPYLTMSPTVCLWFMPTDVHLTMESFCCTWAFSSFGVNKNSFTSLILMAAGCTI